MDKIINGIKKQRKVTRKTRYFRSKLDCYAEEIFQLYNNGIYIAEIGRYLRKKKVKNNKFLISDTQIGRWIKKNGYSRQSKK